MKKSELDSWGSKLLRFVPPAWCSVGLCGLAISGAVYELPRISPSFKRIKMKADLRFDPEVGRSGVAPQALRGVAAEYLLVVSECSCNATFVPSFLADVDRRLPIRVLVAGSEQKAATLAKVLPKGIPVLADPQQKRSRRLNAVFLPRGYVVARDGALLWLQADDNLTLSKAYQAAEAQCLDKEK